MINANEFQTPDRDTVVFLVALGFPFTRTYVDPVRGKTVFCFDGAKVAEPVRKFTSGEDEMVSYAAVCAAQRRVNGIIHSK